MYNLLISSGAAALVCFGLLLALGPAWWWLALLAAGVVFLGSFVLISRAVMKKVEAVMETAMKDIQNQRFEKGVRELKGALGYGKWQIYVTGQVNATIGMVYYLKRDFSNAFPYLEKGFFKNWMAMGMLAVSYMKRNRRDKMKDSFEKAVVASPKESLLWALYAYCLADGGDVEKAKEILQRGLKKLPGDEKLQQNLQLLGDGKKMKMKEYGDLWLQFHLESAGTIQKQQMAALGVRRRIVRR